MIAAAVLLAAGVPAIDPATGLYAPTDPVERGLWMDLDETERRLRQSPEVIEDPALNAYVRQVFCRLVGALPCRSIRIYLVRTPEFNASMSPNGMLLVQTGLLLRAANEAQLAAVLGHEYTHYTARHSIKGLLDEKARTSAMAFAALDMGRRAALLYLPGIYAHGRAQEREADLGGLALMARAGYDTREAARIWEQLRAEMDATAAARGTASLKDQDRGLFGTHPPSAERVAYLTEAATRNPGKPGEVGADRYAAAMRSWWPGLIDDQLKRNDFGGTEFLITLLERQGRQDWLAYAHGEIYRRRGRTGDLEQAEQAYDAGIAAGGTLPELWRGRGLVRLKLRKAAAGRADLADYVRRAPDAPDRAMMAMMAGVPE
jgi:beta-barrel assembly-enhancing protease